MTKTEQIIANIDRIIDEELNLFNSELQAVLEVVKQLVEIRAVELYATPYSFDYEMQKILHESGYYDLIDRFINESYDKNYSNIESLLATGGLATTFNSADIASISALKQLDMDFFRSIGNEAATQLKNDLSKYALSNLDKTTMISNMKEALEGTKFYAHSNTLVDTAISNFNQSLMDVKTANIEGKVYVYTGHPIDKKIRPFCECLMKQRKYYSEEDANLIRKDSKRKYNCRHYVQPLTSKEFAESQGYKEGKFSC